MGPCQAEGCTNLADPRFYIHGPGGCALEACDGCGNPGCDSKPCTCPSAKPQEKKPAEFYVLALRLSNATYWRWWRPRNSGYTDDLDQAGRYSERDIREAPDYYNDGVQTRAIPCEVVDAMKTSRVLYMHNDDFVTMKGASLAVLGEPTPRQS